MGREGKVSIFDVAKLAGVSKSTVSRVLASNGPVKAETKARVLKAIEMLDYKPNLLATGLRAKSGRLIGLILPESILYTFGFLVQALSGVCLENNYGLIIGNHLNNSELESKLFDDFNSRNIDGLIISPVSDASLLGNKIRNILDKVVLIDREITDVDCNSVALDNRAAGRLMGDHLCALGHKRIACVTGPYHISLARERLEGFRASLLSHGVALDGNFVFEGDFGHLSGERAVEHFSADPRFKDITAIWAENDEMAIGILKKLHQLGLRVPDDIALAGMDDTQLGNLSIPSLTTIAQPFHEMAETAVDLLLHPEGRAPKRIQLEPRLIARESTLGAR